MLQCYLSMLVYVKRPSFVSARRSNLNSACQFDTEHKSEIVTIKQLAKACLQRLQSINHRKQSNTKTKRQETGTRVPQNRRLIHGKTIHPQNNSQPKRHTTSIAHRAPLPSPIPFPPHNKGTIHRSIHPAQPVVMPACSTFECNPITRPQAPSTVEKRLVECHPPLALARSPSRIIISKIKNKKRISGYPGE